MVLPCWTVSHLATNPGVRAVSHAVRHSVAHVGRQIRHHVRHALHAWGARSHAWVESACHMAPALVTSGLLALGPPKDHLPEPAPRSAVSTQRSLFRVGGAGDPMPFFIGSPSLGSASLEFPDNPWLLGNTTVSVDGNPAPATDIAGWHLDPADFDDSLPPVLVLPSTDRPSEGADPRLVAEPSSGVVLGASMAALVLLGRRGRSYSACRARRRMS